MALLPTQVRILRPLSHMVGWLNTFVFLPLVLHQRTHKHDLVVKVLEQVYQKGSMMSSSNQPVERIEGGHPPIPSLEQGTAFHPPLGKTGAFKPVDCNQYRTDRPNG